MSLHGWNPAAFDRWLTTQPEPEEECAGDGCPGCPDCEPERALDEDADAYEERAKDSLA